jgi:hypothetical protein
MSALSQSPSGTSLRCPRGSNTRREALCFGAADDTKTYYATDLRKLALENSRIEEEPGEYFEYNNYNPLLIGMIIERATGIPVARYLQQKLWKPIGTCQLLTRHQRTERRPAFAFDHCFQDLWAHAMSTVEGNETLERLLEPRDSQRFVDRMAGLFAEIHDRPLKILCLEMVSLPGRHDPDERLAMLPPRPSTKGIY